MPEKDEHREGDVREAIIDADDTGLVAGEELITETETLLPLVQLQGTLPHKQLHAALPHGHGAHATIDDLRAEVGKASPNPHAIAQHVGTLRVLPELEAIVANWWDDPKTQRIVADLSQIGL